MKHRKRQIRSSIVPLISLAFATALLAAGNHPARAEESAEENPGIANGSNIGQSDDADSQNNRMKTLEGSRSRWSGQLNFTYSGSSLAHPFSDLAPNPGNTVPPPLVTLSGTVSARYRADEATTVGLGTGLTTQTPFQGPKNTTLADPYADIAHSFKLGPLQNRADLQVTVWTNEQYHSSGYRYGFTATNESFHTFAFGLTAGLVLQLDYNIFASGVGSPADQVLFDFYTDPYFEYTVSKRINLRSVIGIPFLHTRDQADFAVRRPEVYQTFGVGIQALDSVFLYPFVQFFPFSGHVTTQTMLVGFNTIINVL